MDKLLGDLEQVASFINDLLARGMEWWDTWEVTKVVLGRVTGAGFMVNLRKCKFLMPSVGLLGHELSTASCRLSEKVLW